MREADKMTDERHVDGNAIGGLLIEVFGREMTDSRGACAACGTVSAVGEFIVYRSGPGDVVRCATCANVVVVAVPRDTGTRIYLAGLRWMAPPA
jgi:hypothetical protein